LRLSREEKIDILQKRIENFKNSIKDRNTFDYAIYESNSPKKDRIRAWGEALEQLHYLGVYTEDIDTISKHIRTELKSMGLSKATDWARHSLPDKYKDSSKIHAEKLLDYEYRENRGFDDHKTKEEITKENLPFIQWAQKNITLFTDFIKKLHTTECLIHIPPLEFNEMITRTEGMDKLIRESWDGREKVLPEETHLLMFAAAQGTKSDMFAKYSKYAREITDMTPKQTVRFAGGRVTKIELLYEPKNKAEARKAGFYGVKCDECGSWRIDHKYHSDMTRNMLFCYACKSWQEIKTEKLMTKVI
jgi:hypothetical protein